MKELVISLILGTATPGGGFPLFGDAFAEMVNAHEPTLRIKTLNTKGSSTATSSGTPRASFGRRPSIATSNSSRCRGPRI